MQDSFEHFLSPLTIRGKRWKNRSVAAPMGMVEIENGHLSEHAKYFLDFYAQGDVAEYIVGETDVNVEGSRAPRERYRSIQEPDMMNGLTECAARIHSHGALAMLELSHCGATKLAEPGALIMGPMEYVRASDGAHIHAMTEEDIARTVSDFAASARTLKRCGFDGAVIHAGHEWLPHQFLSPRTNQRTDRFGGSVENRVRFLVMIMDGIRHFCGEDFIIECRLSGSENTTGGYSMEEMCQTAQILAQHCDIIQVSAGLYYNPVDTLMMSSMFDPHGCNLSVAAEIKKRVNIAVSVVGGFNDPALCEQAVAEGQTDLIVMGRQRLADPQFVKKCEEGRADEIRRCIRCTRCFPGPMEHVLSELTMSSGGMEDFMEQLSRCTVNPAYKHGALESFLPAKKSKRVLIVGGGCAGMQAAITASKRGHQVILIEKEKRLGGILNFAWDDAVKQDLANLVKSMETELTRLPVEVHLNTSFTEELLSRESIDAVIVAVGSRPTTRNIPGMESDHVMNAIDAYRPDTAFGNSVVVLGGGQTGCETAIHIAQIGCNVTLVAKHERLCPDAYRLHGIKLRSLLKELECTVLYNTVCQEIRPEGVLIQRHDGTQKCLPADTVVNALGMEPAFCQTISSACEGLEFYSIGDCVKARTVCEALEEAYLTAIKL